MAVGEPFLPDVLATIGLFTLCDKKHQLQQSDASPRNTQLGLQPANREPSHLEQRMLQVLFE